MGKLSSLVLLCILWGRAVLAQGYIQYVWHGDSNFFQASFQVTQADLQPGNRLANSSLFLSSLSITNPNGLTYQYNGPSSSSLSGTLNPWSFGVILLNFGNGTELFMSGGEPPVGAMAGLIHEKPFSGADLWFETGHWTYSAIPEPSVAALSFVVLVTLIAKKA